MQLLDLEIYIAKRGVLGCPLTEIPRELFSEFKTTKNVEIVLHEENLEMPIMLITENTKTKLYKLGDLETYEGYDARLNLDIWRNIIFNGCNIRTGKLAKCCLLLIEHPEGLDRNFFEESIPGVKKKFSTWMQQLKSCNVVRCEKNGKKQIYKYNFDLLKKGRELNPDIYSVANNTCLIDNPADNIAQEKQQNNNTDHKLEEQQSISFKSPFKQTSTIPDTPLTQNTYTQEEAKQAVAHKIKKARKTKTPDIKSDETKELVNTDRLDNIINLCRQANILVLSELPKQIKKMKADIKVSEDEFLEILEDNGFKVIEIVSKYINTEYVVFSLTNNEKDPSILKVVDRVKNKVSNNFKAKLKKTFLKNIYLNSFDNNYITSLKARVMYFYEYLILQMKKNDGCFYFNLESLLDMGFVNFIKCIPLRLDLQFLKIAAEFIKKTGNEGEALKKNTEDLENLSGADFERLNRKYLQLLEKNTIREVLEGISENTELFKGLALRVSIGEFGKILQSLIKYNIFAGFSDDSFLYFEYLENIEKYLEKLPFNTKDESSEAITHSIPFSERKRFYDVVCKLSQKDFYEEAQKIIDENFEAETREFLTMKLASFK